MLICIDQSQKSKRVHRCYVYGKRGIIKCCYLELFLVFVVCPLSFLGFKEPK